MFTGNLQLDDLTGYGPRAVLIRGKQIVDSVRKNITSLFSAKRLMKQKGLEFNCSVEPISVIENAIE